MSPRYTVINHGRNGLREFEALVKPRYRGRSTALFSDELRLLHYLTSTPGGPVSDPILLTVHRGGPDGDDAGALGPVVGSVMMLPPGGAHCTDLDPTDPEMSAAVAEALYLCLFGVSIDDPEARHPEQQELAQALSSIYGEIAAVTALSTAWSNLTGMSSRMVHPQRVQVLDPDLLEVRVTSVPGYAVLSGSPRTGDSALTALVQDYVDHGPGTGRTPTDLPELLGVMPAETLAVQQLLTKLSGRTEDMIPVGEAFAREARELGDRTVLWIDGARTKRPVAMAHMTHPAEGVLRIGPVHVAVRVPAPPIARHPSLRGREEKYPQLMALAQQAEESISESHPALSELHTSMRDAYRSAVVGEAARLALKAGARYVVIHTVLDDPSAAEMYARIGFRPVASVARVVFSPAGTVALR